MENERVKSPDWNITCALRMDSPAGFFGESSYAFTPKSQKEGFGRKGERFLLRR